MSRLHEMLAVVKSARTRAQTALTQTHHKMQQVEPFKGITRVYVPADDNGEKLPSEAKYVQYRADVLVHEVKAELARMYTVVGAVDATNQVAKADVEVDGTVLLQGVPLTHLLWLEKQLLDLHTFITKIPVLDPAYQWETDASSGVYATAPIGTGRSKKIPRNHVKAEATDKHPAQVEVYYEDQQVGTWQTRHFSGAMKLADVRVMVDRVNLVIDAVRKARERANSVQTVGFTSAPILDYIFQ